MTQITFKVFYRKHDDGKVDVWLSDAPSCTLQEFKDESDINNLVARYKQTGAFYDALAVRNLGAQPRVPMYEDVSEIPDFGTAQEIINRGKAVFEAVPPSVRRKFDNSLELFLAWVTEHKNDPVALRNAGLIGPRMLDDSAPSAPSGVQGQVAPANVQSAPQQAVAASENASEK